MSLQTPTTADISANIIAQLEASLSQTIPLLPRAFLRVLSKALAAVYVILYKYGGFSFLQIFVQTATLNETEINGELVRPLIFWGRLVGAGDPVSATRAEMAVVILVENQVGVLASGAQLLNSSNGFTYVTVGDIALNSATVLGTVRAAADQTDGGGLGSLGNLNPGETINFANPLPNVAREVIITGQTATAADAESADLYRARVISRFQTRSQGGAYADYRVWGEEVAGIVNMYPYTSITPGQVDVYAEATVASSGSADGFPTAAQLVAVAESIETDENGLASRRPAGAFVVVQSITRAAFNVSVTGLAVDNAAQVQSDINAALGEYFIIREPFISGLSFGVRTDRVTRSAVGGVVEGIVSGAGGVFTQVQLFHVAAPGTPIELYNLVEGQKAKIATVSYI